MKWLAAVLCVGCSGQMNDGVGSRREPLEALTVCTDDPSLDPYIQGSVDYWAQEGHAVAWSTGECSLTVRRAHESGRKTRHCYDDNPSTDGWCNGEVGLYDGPASTITLRVEPWERFDEAWRAHTVTHELGHALGVPHSAEAPMWSCEVDEWCLGDAEVQEWWSNAVGTSAR